MHHHAGHKADCECPECEDQEEDCDYCGENLAHCQCAFLEKGYIRRVYLMEHLVCPVCAAKMEKKIREMPAVFFAAVSFSSKRLALISQEDPDRLMPEIQKVCRSIDDEVRIIPLPANAKYKTETYVIPTLDCAFCASKLEKGINGVPGVLSATISYATKQLKVTAADPDALLPEIIRKCNDIEKGTEIKKRDRSLRGEAPKTTERKSGLSWLSGPQEIAVGLVLFILGMVSLHFPDHVPGLIPFQADILLVVSYLVLGGRIIATALRNIVKGDIFDENFLMTVATVGAVLIRELPEAAGVMLFYRIGEYFEDRAADRSRDQIMAAVDLRPETVTVVSGNDTKTIPAEEAKVGDILLIRPGDRIPLDGIVVEGETQIDTSPVTGEPKPVKAAVGDSVSSGCINKTGMIRLQAEKVLAESMVTRILDSVENAVASKPKLDRFITRFARVYTPAVVALALLIAIVPPLFNGEWEHWIYTALTFLVISCPCALVLSVPLSFFAGIGAGSKEGILFKGGTSIETVSRTKAAVLDKTGTITEGCFAVQDVVAPSDMSADEVLALAAGCESFSSHPIARSIVTAAEEKHLALPAVSDIHEIAGEGLTALWNGRKAALGNRRLMKRVGAAIPSDFDDAGAGTEVWVSVDGVFKGRIIISDAIKADAKEAMAELKQMGIATVMLTGDTPLGARDVAAKVGIDDVHAGLLPQDKLEEMRGVRERKGSVLYVGDGINDAPVLAGADAGAAMGSGADAAIEAADLVFLNSAVKAIPTSIKIARTVISTAWQNVVFALVIKIAVMVLGVAGYASMWAAVFADTGVSILCILNSVRLLYKKF